MAAVLVHIDLDGEQPHASSLVALAAGRHVASSWGATLYAVLIAHDPDGPATAAGATGQALTAAKLPGFDAIETALAVAGADKIVVALTDAPITPLWATVGAAWQGVLDHLRPRLVLFGADSPSAPELAPRTGARIGARLLSRARAIGIDDVELRDRDGGYVRASDGGAAVARIGRAMPALPGDSDIDLVVLALPGGADPRIELAGTQPAEIAHTLGAIVALGDDVVGNPRIVAEARRLADRLGAQLVGGPAAAAVVEAGAVVQRSMPLAPELCVTVGAAEVDLAGATSLVKLGVAGDTTVPGRIDVSLTELLKLLELA